MANGASKPRRPYRGSMSPTSFPSTECPPTAPPPGQGAFDDMGMTPGTVAGMLVVLAPVPRAEQVEKGTQTHYNNTIELFCVLEGSVNTILGNGSLNLRPGELRRHAGSRPRNAAPGTDGARILSISIGLSPPKDLSPPYKQSEDV